MISIKDALNQFWKKPIIWVLPLSIVASIAAALGWVFYR